MVTIKVKFPEFFTHLHQGCKGTVSLFDSKKGDLWRITPKDIPYISNEYTESIFMFKFINIFYFTRINTDEGKR